MRRAVIISAAALLLIAAAEPDPTTATSHVVKPGETLGGIANRARVPRVLIIEANGLQPPYALRAGQRLIIPRRRSHVVSDGETGFGIALEYGVPWPAIAAANGINPRAPVRSGQTLAIPTLARGATASPAPAPPAAPAAADATAPAAVASAPPALTDGAAPRFSGPVAGKLRRSFAARLPGKDWHDGIDLVAPRGVAIRAAAAGRVIFAGPGPKEYGLTVIVFHGGRWTTTYSFLDRITVKDGDRVGAGERIGLNGSTGLAREPQLHFEIRRNRVPLDPVRFLPAR